MISFPATVLEPVCGIDLETVRHAHYPGYGAVGYDLNSVPGASAHQRIHHIRSVIRGRKSAVAPLNDGLHAVFLEEIDDGIAVHIIESRLDET